MSGKGVRGLLSALLAGLVVVGSGLTAAPSAIGDLVQTKAWKPPLTGNFRGETVEKPAGKVDFTIVKQGKKLFIESGFFVIWKEEWCEVYNSSTGLQTGGEDVKIVTRKGRSTFRFHSLEEEDYGELGDASLEKTFQGRFIDRETAKGTLHFNLSWNDQTGSGSCDTGVQHWTAKRHE